MENCFYNGNAICTFDLKDASGFYYEDMVIEWKQAAARRELTCMDCGEKVYVAAGPIKEPYFAHYDSKECDYGNGHETEEMKKGKRLLYQLLKRSFPESPVIARYRMENGMYSTVFCQYDEEHKIAIDFRLQNNSLEKFQIRDSYYQINHILPIYILGDAQNKDNKQFTWYQSLIQSSIGFCIFIDVVKESVVFKKSFGYRLGKVRKFTYFKKVYLLKELLIGEDGQFICDFLSECLKIDRKIHDIKEQYLITERKKEEEKEEYRRIVRKLQEDQEEYQRNRENEQLHNLNPIILKKCIKMIEEGNAHLVSKKYYDAIMGRK